MLRDGSAMEIKSSAGDKAWAFRGGGQFAPLDSGPHGPFEMMHFEQRPQKVREWAKRYLGGRVF